mgnify:CR=1 FL=1
MKWTRFLSGVSSSLIHRRIASPRPAVEAPVPEEPKSAADVDRAA